MVLTICALLDAWPQMYLCTHQRMALGRPNAKEFWQAACLACANAGPLDSNRLALEGSFAD